MKENQKLKYLNKWSNHINNCFKAISKGVFKILEELVGERKKGIKGELWTTSRTHASIKIADIDPQHFPKRK